MSTGLVPLGAVAAIAWFRPKWGTPILTVLTAAVVALTAWENFDVRIRELEDRVGPFTMIALLAVAVAVAALGHSKPKPAGMMLLITGVAPLLFAIVGTVSAGPTPVLYVIVGFPMVAAGILYLVSGRITRRAAPPGIEANTVGYKEAA